MKKRTLALLLACLMLTALLTGCGAKNNSSAGSYAVEEAHAYAPAYAADYDEAPAAYEEVYDGDEYYWDAAYESSPMAAVPDPLPPTSSDTGGSSDTAQNSIKLIYTADLSMETLSFDEAVAGLTKLTAECGGYFESSSVSDQGYYRWANYTIRIPAAQYRSFLDRAGETCHILSQREYTEDVSESYYDTAGRLETQRTKLGRLQALLNEAESMEDIITIESAISETEELIDRLSGELRHYDALVDYSTISIYLEEVKVYEPEPDPTYGSRLGGAFMDGLRGFASGLGDILVALAYSWLWILLIAVIVVLILWLTRKRRAAKKAERAERKARMEAAKEAWLTEPVSYSQPSPEPKDEDVP